MEPRPPPSNSPDPARPPDSIPERGTPEYDRYRRERRWAREKERVPRRDGEPALSHWLRLQARGQLLRAGRGIRPGLNGYLGRHSLVGDGPWLERERFPWAEALESRTAVIREEADALLAERDRLPPLRQISPDHSRIADDHWKVYFLLGYGHWLEDHCGRCPRTFEAVRHIPGLESAFFSIVEAGQRIPRHKGPTRAICTAHLGLRVPQDPTACWIRVNREERSWEPGRLLFFDDTYKHEVRNDSDQDRVVLLLHVRRPVRFPATWVRDALIRAIAWSPFVRDGLRNHRRWSEPS